MESVEETESKTYGVGLETRWREEAKDLAVAAIRGSQVVINLDQDFGSRSSLSSFPMFVRSGQKTPSNPKPDRRSVYHKLTVRVLRACQLGTITSPSKLTTATRTR